MIRFILRFICSLLASSCFLTHPFAYFVYRLTGRYCYLLDASVWLNDKYDLDVWKRDCASYESHQNQREAFYISK